MASSLLAQTEGQAAAQNQSQQLIQRLNEISEIYNPEPAQQANPQKTGSGGVPAAIPIQGQKL